MEAMNKVSSLDGFLKVVSHITQSYHAAINGVPPAEQAGQPSKAQLPVAHNQQELFVSCHDSPTVFQRCMYCMYLLCQQDGDERLSLCDFLQKIEGKRANQEVSVERVVYVVTIAHIGHARVMARSQEKAREIARTLKKENVDWNGGVIATDVREVCD